MVSKKTEKSSKLTPDEWNRMLNTTLQDKSLVLMERSGQTAVLQRTKSDGSTEYVDMLEDGTLSRRKDAPAEPPQAEAAPGTPVCEGDACRLPDKLPAPEEKKEEPKKERVEVPGTGMTQEELDAFNDKMIAAQEKKEKEAPKSHEEDEEDERPQSRAPAKQQNRSKEDREVEAVAKMLDLPTRCLKVVRGGDVMVSAAGLAALADRKGYRAIVIKKLDPIQEVATDKTGNSTTTGWVCEVALYPMLDSAMVSLGKDMTPDVQMLYMENLMQPITNIGTATNKNCRPEMYPYMREMAVTRAINRAFRVFTACGFTSLEEMQDYQGDEAPA